VDTVISIDDPRREDVRALVALHLAFSRGTTPAEFSFALDLDELLRPDVTFFTARRDGQVVAMAALKRLDGTHAELKSMHTREGDRNLGIGRTMVAHLLEFARQRGYRQVSLETGTTDEFAPARALYQRSGFGPCAAFGEYAASPYNTFMTISVEPGA
jgi:putative acetyltransferase